MATGTNEQVAHGAPRIVHLDKITMGGFEIPRPGTAHEWIEHDFTEPQEVAARLAGAQVAIINKVRLDAAMLGSLPALKLIAVTATGTDVVDSVAAKARGIEVRNVVGYAGTSVAEHVMMLILALARGLVPFRNSVVDGQWENGRAFCVFAAPVRDLAGQRLGLFGSGAIAQAVASRAQAMGMDVVFAGRQGQPAGEGRLAFEEVLATSDIISLHCPLTDDTRHMLNAQTLAGMKAGAVIINTARGALIDLDALEDALASGHIGGAGIDVAPVEPPPPGSPILRLAQRDNVIVTPHSAWLSAQAVTEVARRTGENVATFLAAR
ncbi:glycerate dehydrogenase [Sphingobium sp. B1D7B]|uniref:NAD(P)-dependent oxidoreductase n=1 Tax=unclassified Sphingobium TaxID=2611147 RepID=UPI002223FE8A|nr:MULTISPECIES: NAD(P)-dependent oxidoreductase [unclassified Sphingobium]MCW2392204.1 glycerate dehydrogenase [Sphingobium sp. B11D3A]MCW2403910.1 glycerate dehydrogenase [Sphingobium sp. B1D7B]